MRTRAVAILATFAVAFAVTADSPPPPADLRVAWTDKGEPLAGEAGQTVPVQYVIRNLGGQNAFAVIVKIRTVLGPVGPAVRVQPGPDAGKALTNEFRLALADGMRELCIDVQLQNLSAEDPPDPNLKDNRVCRPVRVGEQPGN